MGGEIGDEVSLYRGRAEKDPYGKSAKEPGSKLDAGKAPIWQGLLAYFPRALTKVSEVSAYGANKYAWKGWQSVPDGQNRYANALGRHLVKEAIEGPWDQDIKNDPNFPGEVLHAAQVAWNALARLELMLQQDNPIQPIRNPGPWDRQDGQKSPTPTVREQMDPKPLTALEETTILSGFYNHGETND